MQTVARQFVDWAFTAYVSVFVLTAPLFVLKIVLIACPVNDVRPAGA
jgi:hypothetical protein